MKKHLFMAAIAALCLASCTTTNKTARTEVMPYSMYNASVADLDVSPERVVYTMTPSKELNRAGEANCKRAAVQECLSKNGNADLLVEPMFVVSVKKTWFGKKVTSVTVSGRPAKYKNFRSMPDGVWTDPVFRGSKNVSYKYINGKSVDGCPKK
ncbi:MAG: hypothetical protein IJQ05_01670 [Bacteroidaceae bacterium]|nr:hypothetical protein [Bacteroidaceae bacterium]